MDNLKTVRNRCDVLLAAANVSGDKERINTLLEVQEFLKDDNCFVQADEFKFTYFMLSLGYNFDQLNKIYDYYNNIKTYSGILEYTDGDGNVFQEEAILCPDVEDYYMFDNGLIFKFDNRKNKFYSLIDGEWIYNSNLEKKFYDSEYDYERIQYKIIEKDFPRR